MNEPFEYFIRSEMLNNLNDVIEYHNKNFNKAIPENVIESIKGVISRISWKSHIFINHSDSDYLNSAIILNFYSNTGFGTLEYVFYFKGNVFCQIIDNDLHLDAIGPVNPKDITDEVILQFMRTGSVTTKPSTHEKTIMILLPFDCYENFNDFYKDYANIECKLEREYKYKILNSNFYIDWFHGMHMPEGVKHKHLYFVSKLLSLMSECDAVYIGRSNKSNTSIFSALPLYVAKMMPQLVLIYEDDE